MDNTSLYHHGIKGMKWGIRRYQRKDGSLTPAGKMRAKRHRNPINAIVIGSAFVLNFIHIDLVMNDGRRTRSIINTSLKAARRGEQFVRRYL